MVAHIDPAINSRCRTSPGCSLTPAWKRRSRRAVSRVKRRDGSRRLAYDDGMPRGCWAVRHRRWAHRARGHRRRQSEFRIRDAPRHPSPESQYPPNHVSRPDTRHDGRPARRTTGSRVWIHHRSRHTRHERLGRRSRAPHPEARIQVGRYRRTHVSSSGSPSAAPRWAWSRSPSARLNTPSSRPRNRLAWPPSRSTSRACASLPNPRSAAAQAR